MNPERLRLVKEAAYQRRVQRKVGWIFIGLASIGVFALIGLCLGAAIFTAAMLL